MWSDRLHLYFGGVTHQPTIFLEIKGQGHREIILDSKQLLHASWMIQKGHLPKNTPPPHTHTHTHRVTGLKLFLHNSTYPLISVLPFKVGSWDFVQHGQWLRPIWSILWTALFERQWVRHIILLEFWWYLGFLSTYERNSGSLSRLLKVLACVDMILLRVPHSAGVAQIWQQSDARLDCPLQCSEPAHMKFPTCWQHHSV
jgi:hypothetical protein